MEHPNTLTGTGWFWRVDKPEDRRVGTVSTTEQGRVILHILNDPTNPRPPFAPMDGTDIDVLGTVGTKEVTLNRCTEFSTDLFTASQRLDVAQALVGGHFADPSSAMFDAMTITADHLFNWVGASVVSEHPTYRDSGPLERLTLEVTPRPPMVDDGDDFTLEIRHGWNSAGIDTSSLSVTQRKNLSIRFAAPQPLNTLMRLAEHVEVLVSLGAAKPCSIRTATVHWTAEDGKKRSASLWRLRMTQEPTNEVGSAHFLFTLDDLGGLPGVRAWLNHCTQHPVAIGSLASQRSGQHAVVENRLQNAANAAETYHRGQFANTVRPKAEYRTLRRDIVRSAPLEHQDWLNNVLAYANEKRLRDRLHELVAHAGPAFVADVGNADDLCREITNTRNSIAHHDTPTHRPDTLRMHYLSEATFLLVTLCMLRDIGVSESGFERIGRSVPVRTLQHWLEATAPER